ncbi:50S ribosomal protein L18 [Patescibacteria group bacterium]
MATRKSIIKKYESRSRRHNRVRSRVQGTADAPRLVVFRGSQRFDAQLIDDVAQKTLLAISDRKADHKGTKIEKAQALGEEFGKQIDKAGIKTIIFDRGGFLYQGRVAAFAEGVRKAGIKF